MSIQIKVGGAIYEGWTAIEVNRSMESLSGFFSMSVSNKFNSNISQFPILKPGQNCQILVNRQQVMNGYIDKVNIHYDAVTHTMQIEGRDKAGDLVDCSVTGNTGEWKGLKLEAIVEAICQPFGIKVTTHIDTGEVIPAFNVEQGMTAFEAIQKLCALRACLALSDNNGGILITRAAQSRASNDLIEGQNIKSAEAEYDVSQRFSQYIVKGQQQGADNTGTINITAGKAVVRDETIPRYRPVILISDGQTDSNKALMRAKWEASVKRGKSRTFTVIVNGWQQKNGALWNINQQVRLKSPMLGADDVFIIAGLIYKLDEEGELTELALTDASAYELLKEDTIKKSADAQKAKFNPYLLQ